MNSLRKAVQSSWRAWLADWAEPSLDWPGHHLLKDVFDFICKTLLPTSSEKDHIVSGASTFRNMPNYYEYITLSYITSYNRMLNDVIWYDLIWSDPIWYDMTVYHHSICYCYYIIICLVDLYHTRWWYSTLYDIIFDYIMWYDIVLY